MTKYRFRYKSVGSLIEVPPAPAAAQGDAPHEESAKAPTLRTAAGVINDLRNWIEKNRDFGLDMGLLEQRDLLIAPPNWTYIVDLAARPTRDAEAEQTLEEYVRMLGSRQRTLDTALQFAAFASIGQVGEPAERLRHAIRALPKGGRIMHDDFTRPSLRLEPLLKQRRATAWAKLIRTRCEELMRRTAPDWETAEKISWSQWQARLAEYRVSRRDVSVTGLDLLLRTRVAGPPALLRNELTRMTLREWSEALLNVGKRPGASLQDVPQWLAGEVLREVSHESRFAILILGGSATSPTAQWLPSRKYSALWIDQFAIGQWSSGFIFGSNDVVIAFEVGGEGDVIEQVRSEPPEMKMAAEHLLRANVRRVFIGKNKLPPEVTPVFPYIENPTDVDDAISKAHELTRRRSFSPLA